MPGNPLTNPDWASDITKTVDRFVGTVRSTATDRAAKAARAVVFGIVAAVAGVSALILLTIIANRLIQRGVQTFAGAGRAVWMAYGIVGVLLIIGGLLVLRLRYSKDDAQ
jgi:hypothetical protein